VEESTTPAPVADDGDQTEAKVETDIDASSSASAFEMAAMGEQGFATESMDTTSVTEGTALGNESISG
jgi:hypothetical protein